MKYDLGIFWHFPGATDKNHGSTVVRTVGLDLSQEIPGMKQRLRLPRSYVQYISSSKLKQELKQTQIEKIWYRNFLQCSQKHAFNFT